MWISREVKEQIKITSMYSLFESDRKSGYSFEGESHNFWECVYIEKGGIRVSADERIYSMTENDIIFHKPLELHKFDVQKDSRLFIFSFSANGSLMNFFRDKVFSLNERQQSTVNDFLNFLKRKEGINGNYSVLFSADKTFLQIVISYIYILFLDIFNENEETEILVSPDSEIFSQAVGFMNERIFSSASISEIARHCRISPSGLKRIFKKYSGLSVHKYFIKMKINSATELLNEGYNITETADKLGFSSQGYFSHTYKRETGISPSAQNKHNISVG